MADYKHQKEVLLRDVYEFAPASMYLLLAILLIVMVELSMAIPIIAYTLATIFAIRCIYLYKNGKKLKNYQKNLTQLQMYRMKSKDIRVSQKEHFLGLGFEWTATHAQRLYDLALPKNKKYREYSKIYKMARNYERFHEKSIIAKFTSSNSNLNPVRPAPPLEGDPWLHAVGLFEPEERIFQSLGNRVGHTWVQGTTRVGKTRLAELTISQDIARGDIVIVIDPKGDADLMLRCYSEAKRAGREDDFYLFHLGYPDVSAQYNPVGSFMRITEVATRIANQMPGEGQSAAFKEFVWGFVNQVSKGLVGIGKTPSYPLIKQYSQDLEPLYIEFMEKLLAEKINTYADSKSFTAEIKEYKAIVNMKAEDRRDYGFTRDISAIKGRSKESIAYYCLFKDYEEKLVFTHTEIDIARSLTKAFITDQSYLSKLVASLDPFLEKMTTGSVAELISPNFEDPNKDVFDWGKIIQSGGIVYVGLDALSDQEVARTVGASMLADLTSQYGRIYKEGRNFGLPNINGITYTEFDRPIRIHIDEGNEPADKTLIPSLNKAGGAGVSVTLYTQTSSDLEARLGSKAFANQMLGNFNTVISFRVQDEDTAKIFTSKQSNVTVYDLLDFSSSTDNSDIESDTGFSSSTQSRLIPKDVPLIKTEDLTKLPKGQFFMMMDGNKLYKCRVPWLVQDDDDIPDDVRLVAKKMRSNYQSELPPNYGYKDEFKPEKLLNTEEQPNGFMDFVNSINSHDGVGVGYE